MTPLIANLFHGAPGLYVEVADLINRSNPSST